MALKITRESADRLLRGNRPKSMGYYEEKIEELEKGSEKLLDIIQTYKGAHDQLIKMNRQLSKGGCIINLKRQLRGFINYVKKMLYPPWALKKYALPPLHEVKIIVYPTTHTPRRLLNLPPHNKEHETNIHVQVNCEYTINYTFILPPLINLGQSWYL